MEGQFLKHLERLLDEYGYPCVVKKASDDVPFEHLNFQFPPDSKNRERICILKVENDVLTVPRSQVKEAIESFIQLYVILPFSIEKSTVGEVARIVSFFNKSLVTPGFVLDEASERVFFRYAFFKPGAAIEESTFISLIGTIQLWLDSFSDSIEEVAQGKGMIEVIQEKMKELLQPSGK